MTDQQLESELLASIQVSTLDRLGAEMLLKAVMNPRPPRRKIIKVEWSPSRNLYVEILSCGHHGPKTLTREQWIHMNGPRFRMSGRSMRECKECSK